MAQALCAMRSGAIAEGRAARKCDANETTSLPLKPRHLLPLRCRFLIRHPTPPCFYVLYHFRPCLISARHRRHAPRPLHTIKDHLLTRLPFCRHDVLFAFMPFFHATLLILRCHIIAAGLCALAAAMRLFIIDIVRATPAKRAVARAASAMLPFPAATVTMFR